MTSLTERLAFQRELPRYLRELAILLGRLVSEDELLSLEETRLVRERANHVPRRPTTVVEIPFEQKETSRFQAFLERLAIANSKDVYLWTAASNHCGVIRPLPLRFIRMTFPFDLNPEGIVTLLTSDLRDALLLDFSLGGQGEQLLEVEASGESWGKIAY